MSVHDLSEAGHIEPQAAAFDSKLGWTSAELEPLAVESLRLVLARDLRTEPTGTSRTALLKQIQSEQMNHIARGDLRWKRWDAEDVLLYNPTAAHQGTAIVRTLESVIDWADLRRLVESSDPAADFALPYLWALWASNDYKALGLDEDYEADETISQVEHLLEAIPSRTSLELRNLDDDSEFCFVDPFSPWQMGVPWLIIRRYCADRSNIVDDWTAAESKELVSIGNTAAALGWSFDQGQDSDLGSLL